MLKPLGQWIAKIAKDAVTKLLVKGMVALASTYFVWETWSAIVSAFDTTWKWLLAPTEVSRWQIALLAAFSALFVVIVAVFVIAALREPAPKPLDWRDSYTQDTLFGMCFHWRNLYGNIEHLGALCPKCSSECELTSPPYGYHNKPLTFFRCLTCGHQSEEIPADYCNAVDRVKVEIRRRVNSGEWVQRIVENQHTSPRIGD